MEKKATIVMTSYKRFDLLNQTLDSITKLDTSKSDIIVVDDTFDKSFEKGVRDRWENHPNIKLVFNEKRTGQISSIDIGYRLVETPYIWHTEEDYLYTGNPNFIADSIAVLEERKDYCVVIGKKIGRGFGLWDENYVEMNSHFTTTSGVSYKNNKNGWEGGSWIFSFNPGMRRTHDYKNLFPNGYEEVILPTDTIFKNGVLLEYKINNRYREAGFCAGILANSCCVGRGDNMSCYRMHDSGWNK